MGSGADDFLARMRVARRDLGRLLFHLTRTPAPQTPPLRTRSYPPSAQDALRNILIEGRLAGTSGFIRGGYKCICFSESPITELVSLFKLSELAAQQSQRPKYEPYGVAVTKDWLFARGGRPVIYQPDSEYEQLPESLRYRHVRYEPPGIDFTWEREWRLCANELRLEPESTLVVVPTSKDAFDIMYTHADWQADFDRDGEPEHAYPEPEWMAVSLDFFG